MMPPSFDLLVPRTIPEALAMLAEPGARPIAGGTDVIPLWHAGKLCADHLVDLSRLRELCGISEEHGTIRVGALTTHAQLAALPLIQSRAPLLAEAAASVGGMQTRHRGTVGGNLVNASPAADVATALMALEAQAILRSTRGERALPLEQFFTAPGRTAKRDDELLMEIRFKVLRAGDGSTFQKLGRRKALIIAVVSAAVVLRANGNSIMTGQIALGSVAPTIIRAHRAEALLRQNEACEELFERAGQLAAQETRPIDDIRGSAAYRRLMAAVLVRRALAGAWMRALGGASR